MKPAMVLVSMALCAFATLTYAQESSDRQIYADRCVKCHGETGTGTFMLGRRLGKEKGMLEHRIDLTPELIRHVVRNGIVSMPAITRVEVTDAELDAIVRYLTRTRTAAAESTNR